VDKAGAREEAVEFFGIPVHKYVFPGDKHVIQRGWTAGNRRAIP
jgi:hypothetical protein